MPELCHATRIYRDSETGAEIERPCSFRFEDVIDLNGSKGCGELLPFRNKAPKTYVSLTGGRGYWLLVPLSQMRREWEAYLSGVPCWNFAFSQS